MKRQRFIVGEVSKNWTDETAATRRPEMIQALFEEMIEFNLKRRYKLHSFSLHRLMTSATVMNETIIAVFEAMPCSAEGSER